MFDLGTPIPELILRSVVIYIVFVIALRLFGKREVGQFTLFDLALVLLAANALQPAMTGPDTSLLGGLVLVATLFTIDRVFAGLRGRVPFVRRLIQFQPTVVGRDGRWLVPAMAREGLDFIDVDAALREHGLASVSELKLATLEADGSISIVANDDDSRTDQLRRRRHYRRPV